MAKRIGHVVLIGALLISVFHGICVANDWDDWGTRLSENINRHVQDVIQNVNQQIQHSLKHSLEPALEEVQKTIENLPKDAQGRIITNSGYGNTVIVNNGNGLSRSIVSGQTKDGEPFVRDVEERHDGSMLYHYETYYKPRTNTSVKTCWKLDHSKPGAIPEILKDC